MKNFSPKNSYSISHSDLAIKEKFIPLEWLNKHALINILLKLKPWASLILNTIIMGDLLLRSECLAFAMLPYLLVVLLYTLAKEDLTCCAWQLINILLCLLDLSFVGQWFDLQSLFNRLELVQVNFFQFPLFNQSITLLSELFVFISSASSVFCVLVHLFLVGLDLSSNLNACLKMFSNFVNPFDIILETLNIAEFTLNYGDFLTSYSVSRNLRVITFCSSLAVNALIFPNLSFKSSRASWWVMTCFLMNACLLWNWASSIYFLALHT